MPYRDSPSPGRHDGGLNMDGGDDERRGLRGNGIGNEGMSKGGAGGKEREGKGRGRMIEKDAGVAHDLYTSLRGGEEPPLRHHGK